MSDAFPWVLAVSTIALHWSLRSPSRHAWAVSLVIDAGWALLYATTGLWGPLAMTGFFVVVHVRNLITTPREAR